MARDGRTFYVTVEKMGHGIILQVSTKKENVRDYLVANNANTSVKNPRTNVFMLPLQTDECVSDCSWR